MTLARVGTEQEGVTEHERLAMLEGVIERGLVTFVEVGLALLEIRDLRLYRWSHGTFEAYCRERWGWSRRRANQQIAAAQVAGVSGTTVPKPPNEAVARELTAFASEPEQVREVWSEVVERHGPEPTAAEVRDVVAPRLGVHFSSASDQWATPQDLFDVLDREFHFTLDVCASATNAKCSRYYSPNDDGLASPWVGVCWMNPPYGDAIVLWVRKAYESAQAGATVVCLVPARVDTGWWWDYCRFGEIRFLRGRLRFGGSDTGAPFPSAVVAFPRDPVVRWWEWQND